MFRAERRGLNKVNEIRVALDSLGLMTDQTLNPQDRCARPNTPEECG